MPIVAFKSWNQVFAESTGLIEDLLPFLAGALLATLVYVTISRNSTAKSRAELNQLRETRDILEKTRFELINTLNEKSRELTTSILELEKYSETMKVTSDMMQSLKRRYPQDAEVKEVSLFMSETATFADSWERFKIHFEGVHPSFFSKLSTQYPDLTQKELRHCAYIKMNLDVNEVANLTGVAQKSVEMARYRIKKKMGNEEYANLLGSQ